MKDTTEDKNWGLMLKYLGKELSDEERAQFDKWLEQSDANRKELENAEKIWQLSSSKESGLFDADQGWGKMQRRIHHVKGIQSAIRNHILMTTMRVAASLLILIVLAFAVRWVIGKSSYVKIIAEKEKILKPIVLPDGSKVCLNIGSSIRYPKSFNKNTREVELTGEAFFDIVHNAQQPFVIRTSQAQIKVLGTQFDISAYKECDSLQVIVKTGTVELSSGQGDKTIRLTQGNTGVYFTSSNKMVKLSGSDVNAFAWKTNDIVFHESNLDYVSKTLKKVFSKPIILENAKLKNCRLNADFKNRDLESIIEVIKETLNLQIKKTNDGYILTGPGC